jgi:ArsR family transcriptional regulator, cadmium/lead-responsive transcriptional repressor
LVYPSASAVQSKVMASTMIDLDALGRVGVALADGTRRRILVELVAGPAHPGELAQRLGLTRANVSNHLSCLRGCGLIVGTPIGRRVRYELADPRLGLALAQLVELALPAPDLCDHHLGPRP